MLYFSFCGDRTSTRYDLGQFRPSGRRNFLPVFPGWEPATCRWTPLIQIKGDWETTEYVHRLGPHGGLPMFLLRILLILTGLLWLLGAGSQVGFTDRRRT